MTCGSLRVTVVSSTSRETGNFAATACCSSDRGRVTVSVGARVVQPATRQATPVQQAVQPEPDDRLVGRHLQDLPEEVADDSLVGTFRFVQANATLGGIVALDGRLDAREEFADIRRRHMTQVAPEFGADETAEVL
jgi:hypothetical protein